MMSCERRFGVLLFPDVTSTVDSALCKTFSTYQQAAQQAATLVLSLRQLYWNRTTVVCHDSNCGAARIASALTRLAPACLPCHRAPEPLEIYTAVRVLSGCWGESRLGLDLRFILALGVG